MFDLPETDRDESTFDPNLEFVAGSFFDSVPSGDAYLLSGIIHDWDDEAATRILRTIASSARPGARVLATESVIQPGNQPDGAKWLDLLMLTLAGGRERTEPQWRALLKGAGSSPSRSRTASFRRDVRDGGRQGSGPCLMRGRWLQSGLGVLAWLAVAEHYLRARGVEYLQRKTRGPPAGGGFRADRGLLPARGFVPPEENVGLGSRNPCVLLATG